MMRKKWMKRMVSACMVSLLVSGSVAGCQSNSSGTEQTEDTGRETSDTGRSEETTKETEAETTAEAVQPEKVEVSVGQVAMGGGGFVTGLISTCEAGVYYARTDVGGAYRWDKDKKRWVSLSYDITEADRGLLGVDGLAVDPQDAAKVYMICGTSYFSGGKTCIFISHDYGETFERVDVTAKFKNHGNGMGRQNGERIAVDPNNGEVILAGGRTGGMFKSTDGGKSWESVDFPVTSTANGNGICAIAYTADSSKIYAAVSDKGKNIYVSEDGGENWKTVDGLPEEFMPQRVKFDAAGNLLITYSGAEGPWNGNGGAIWKLDAHGVAADISPDQKSFGDVAADPSNPDQLVASTENIWSQQPNGSYGDEFYVSRDGGKTWKNILGDMTMSTGGIPWIKDYAIHWAGSIMLDPVDTGKMMVTSGNGVFACDNIWDEKPEFYFNATGIEETVPLDAVSVKGGPLITAIGDYDGFVHDDIYSFPDRFSTTVGTNTSVAVAGTADNVWIRVGNDDKKQNFLYSLDAGKTWTNITNKPDGKLMHGGKAAVTADGKTFIWFPENAQTAYYTKDYGETWQASTGLIKPTYMIADPVNPDYVYGMQGDSFWVSQDGGKTFEKTIKYINDAIRCAVVPGVEGKVYIPGGMNGVYVSDDFGKTSKTLSSVIWCSMVSTGKGIDENTPALYIWGSVAGGDGIGMYMSKDGGESWTKLNEEGVEFGGPGNGQFVLGDQNVFGRCYMSTVGLGLIYFQCK